MILILAFGHRLLLVRFFILHRHPLQHGVWEGDNETNDRRHNWDAGARSGRRRPCSPACTATEASEPRASPGQRPAMGSLTQKVDTLRVQLGLVDGQSIVESVNEAVFQFGLADQVKGFNLVQKADACLTALGTPSASAAAAPDVSDAAPPPLTWEGVQAQLTQLGYPATACIGCTPIEARGKNATCFHSMGGGSLLCSVCHYWAGSRLALDDPSATREMLRGKVPPTSAQAVKPLLDAAFPADAYMSEAHLRHLNTAITRNFARLTPKALADMFDELGDRSFISAAQAADLLATIREQDSDYYGPNSDYYHVICHRILDRWNTDAGAHGIGDCYHGWHGDPHRVLEAARTGRGPRSNREISVYVQNELFVQDKLRFDGRAGSGTFNQAHPAKLPGFYTSLLRRLGD